MDLDAVRTFIKVAELASFSRAAEQLGIQKARASLQVKALEADLGIRLLQRTTRVVRPTPDGEQFLARAARLLSDADELSAMFQSPRALRGVVRLDLPINFARELVIPRLPELYALYPHLELQLSITDRRVDVVRDGFDCVLRIGALVDSGLIVRRLGVLPMTNCASPAYLRTYGTPRGLADLDRHFVVHYAGTFGADAPTFEHRAVGVTVERPMRAMITVNNVEAYQATCRAGLGIIQCPRVGVADALASGELVEILPEHTCAPMPVSFVHGHGNAVPRRVRAVMAWVAQVVAPRLA
ncbi:MAG TPA: LysR family transcriptional regulator [Kofleriaceae bacterium]